MLPLALEKRLDLFESRWGSADAPSIESLVADLDDSLRLELLAELVMTDLELRDGSPSADGPPLDVEGYFDLFPELKDHSDFHAKIVAHWNLIRNQADPSSPSAHATVPLEGDRSLAAQSGSGASLQPPCRLGKFKLTRKIGDGGMGAVFEAEQDEPHRTVAIKVLHSNVASDEDAEARFSREIEIVSLIDDPGVVPIYEAGCVDGYRYFVMPMLSGGTLRQKIHEGQLSTRDSARMLRDLSRAADVAHQQGIVHRDLKPGNVLFGSDDRPQIADFGLSRQIDQSQTLTRTGQICGTPGYIAPERIVFGHQHVEEIPSDVYSLGAVLYDMLCGRPPYRGASLWETFAQSMSAPPVPPTKLNPDVDRDLETICLKCLERDPRKRYLSCGGLNEDLDRYLLGEPILARRPGIVEQTVRYMKRHPARSGLAIASLALVVFGIAAVALLFRLRLRDMELENMQTLSRAEQYLAEVSKADVLMSNRDVGWREDSLELLADAAALDFPTRDNVHLRSRAASVLVQRDMQPIATLSEGMWCDAIDFDPTGRYIALGQNRDKDGFVIHIYSLADLEAEPRTLWIDCARENEARVKAGVDRPEDGVRAIRFSPDGNRLAIGTRHGCVHIYQWTGQDSLHLGTYEPDPGVEVYQMRFSPRGDSLWVLSDNDKLRRIRNRQLEVIESIGDAKVRTFEMSPTEDAFFAVVRGVGLCRYDFHQTEPRWTRDDLTVGRIAMSADGRFLAAPTVAGLKLETLDTTLGRTQTRITTESDDGGPLSSDPVFGSDGSYILTTTFDRTIVMWDVASRKSLARYVVPQRGGKPRIAASSSAPLVAVTEHLKVTLYEITGIEVQQSVGGFENLIRDFHVDNAHDRIVAVGTHTGERLPHSLGYGVWRASDATRLMTHHQFHHTANSYPSEPSVSISPDGKNLLSVDIKHLPQSAPIENGWPVEPFGAGNNEYAWVSDAALEFDGGQEVELVNDPDARDGSAHQIRLQDPYRITIRCKQLPEQLQNRDSTTTPLEIGVICRFEDANRPKTVSMRSKTATTALHQSMLNPSTDGFVELWMGAHIVRRSSKLAVTLEFSEPVETLLVDGVLIRQGPFRDQAVSSEGNHSSLGRIRTHGTTGQVWAVLNEEELRVFDFPSIEAQSTWNNLSSSHVRGRGTLEPLLDTQSWLISGTTGGEIFVFDAESFKLVESATYLETNVRAMCEIPQVDQLVVGYNDGTIQILTLPDLKVVQSLNHHGLSVESVCYDSKRHWLFAGSEDGAISIWHRVGGQFELYFQLEMHLGRISRMSLVESSDSLAVLIRGETTIRLIRMPALCDRLRDMGLID